MRSRRRMLTSVNDHVRRTLQARCIPTVADVSPMQPETPQMSLNDRTSAPPQKSRQNPLASSIPSASAHTFVERLVALNSQAAGMRLRANQRLSMGTADDTNIFAIRSGVLLVRAALPHSLTPYLSLKFAGDVISPAAIPVLADRAIIATTACEVWRFKVGVLAEFMAAYPDLVLAYEAQRNHQAVRTALHTTIIGALDGHQRVAAFLIELAGQIGVPTGGSVLLDLPLSRVEIAQYLSLNADTLSRIMSRYKQEGLVSQTNRHRLILRDWKRLLDQCPIADAILATAPSAFRTAKPTG